MATARLKTIVITLFVAIQLRADLPVPGPPAGGLRDYGPAIAVSLLGIAGVLVLRARRKRRSS